MARTAGIRWTAWIAGLLVLGLLAAWIWWRESDTAGRWRFEKAMGTFCGGVLAHEKSPLFEGLWPGLELSNDRALGPDAYACFLGDHRREVTVALLRADAHGGQDMEELLPPLTGRRLPVPLAGDWRGAADGDSVRVLVGCQGGDDFVSVTVDSYISTSPSETEEARQEQESGWLDGDVYWARFATATAVKAADRWGCEAEEGKPLRTLPPVTGEEQTTGADGTCAGLPFSRDPRLDVVEEATAGGTGLYEICKVGAPHYFDARYVFSARFGPYALRARDGDSGRGSSERAGTEDGAMWASARCPGDSERALFAGYVPPEAATVWLPGDKGKETFGLPAFREFVERSAARHGCTDLRMPTP
ncbi:hypothetical protein OG230_35010 [Streptomyces sp. NBC_00234]|uniref:hypothetical protein n=1 Tax=Streptomyces sp. NBC_00234 TaxID=2903638 RepID=UPI002E29618F|nr:hypothetical protein [Streptomyces sp. NBC_00234]